MTKLVIGGKEISPGQRVTVNLPLALLHTQTPLEMPVRVWRGKRDGARLFISAAIHGDEINGVEIIRRLLQHKSLANLRGTLITIPTVNVYGVIQHSRYLPDRRDLNRSFPGSERGSLASRLADLFMREIVQNCTHGIDLHTGALHRSNLPQLRVNLEDPEILPLARAFEVPTIINSDLRDGSLRQAATEIGIHTLLYEAGEALRFDELSIRAGVKGIINVMRVLGMLPKKRYTAKKKVIEPLIARSTVWVRAPESGIFRAYYALGQAVKKNDVLGIIASPFGDHEEEVIATSSGIVIGRSSLPLINEGDALFHIARFSSGKDIAENVETFTETITEPEKHFEEPPIL
jgi:predicted deacylase